VTTTSETIHPSPETEMPTTDKQKNSAAFATKSATEPNSQGFKDLSSKMCWEAAAYCFQKGAAIDDKGFKAAQAIKGTEPKTYAAFIDTAKDPVVADANAMRAVPQGCFLGFFTVDGSKKTLIHAMISTGQGLAAGNKNECIGIGNPVGWEIINLAGNYTNPITKKTAALKWEPHHQEDGRPQVGERQERVHASGPEPPRPDPLPAARRLRVIAPRARSVRESARARPSSSWPSDAGTPRGDRA
jgi:hypothetical protein